MKFGMKSYLFASLGAISLLLAACSGVPSSSSGSGSGSPSGGSNAFSIGGTVTGLSGSGLVLQDNSGDNLSITASGPFTFKTKVTGAYAVTIMTQPTGPTQTCTITGGSGTASANVTTVAVACATNAVTATIGGTLSGLATGASVILQDNGGDALTLTANGAFTFKTPVTGPTDAYAVTVNTQPTTPNQICAVQNGSGTATANVTNVAVACVNAYLVGGNITGLVGNGLVLTLTETGANATNQQLKVTAPVTNGPFAFANTEPTGSAYTVAIGTQPTGPTQQCVVGTGTGSGNITTQNITTVVITCPAVTYSVGGTVVGLEGVTPHDGALIDGSFVLQNVLGNSLIVTQNGPFTFATPEALNDQYEVSVFHGPSTQHQGCTTWNYKGVVTANVSDILVDCAHNDWTWIDGTKTAGTAVPVAPQYGSFPPTAPTTGPPNPFTNTPGARYGAAGWTDSSGSLFLFGGFGWELAGKNPPDTAPATMSDLWVCDMSFGDFCQWQLVGGYDPTPFAAPAPLNTVGGQIVAAAQSGFGLIAPPARLGAAAWTDNSGNFWLFAGSNGNNFLTDLWKYNPSGLAPGSYTTTEGVWTHVAGSAALDQPGNYTSGTLAPGSRTNATTWTDSSGNLWLFGGYGYDGQSPAVLGFLNDLWEYTGGNWVWVSGGNTFKANQNGIYGTQGTAASTNMPGGRQEAVGWADANGNLWLFGGEGEDSVGTANGILNDLWVYNIANNQWTFVLGSNKANQTGVYGLQPLVGPPNTASAAGTAGLTGGTSGTLPGSRWGASGWVDATGHLWLYGGWGLDSNATNGNGALNDLWVYTPNATAGQAGTWTWIKGSNTGSQNGVYGDELIPYKTYQIWTPGGRSNGTHWVDNQNQLWLFGGEGYDSTSTTGNGYLNDLWRYLPYP